MNRGLLSAGIDRKNIFNYYSGSDDYKEMLRTIEDEYKKRAGNRQEINAY